jgi:hypothetical protein
VFDFNDSYRIRDDCTRCMIDCYRDASVMQHVAIALSDSVAMLQQGRWCAAAQGLVKRSVFDSVRSVLEDRSWIRRI